MLAGSFLLAYLAWIKPQAGHRCTPCPLYAVIIFVIPLEVKPTVLLQLLFAASLTVLVIRLNIRFSTLPAKDKYEDPMEKFLYAYMHRITPYFRSIDSDTAHEIAWAVLSFKFGIYPNTIGGADKAIARLKGEGAFATLRKALTIMRDRAESLQESMVKSYSEKTFFRFEDITPLNALTSKFVSNRPALEDFLQGELVSYLPRMVFKTGDLQYDIIFEAMDDAHLKIHGNAHYQYAGIQLPSSDNLKSSYIAQYDHLRNIIEKLLND